MRLRGSESGYADKHRATDRLPEQPGENGQWMLRQGATCTVTYQGVVMLNEIAVR